MEIEFLSSHLMVGIKCNGSLIFLHYSDRERLSVLVAEVSLFPGF